MSKTRKVIIMGAAGRDFHNFNVCFRNDPSYRVVAFTAFQIPNIAGRTYPAELAGPHYPEGIPIHDESELPALVRRHEIDEVVFAYSDVPHLEVMHRAALVDSLGADFKLMGSGNTAIKSSKPVISVCAVRTGCGKSQTTRALAALLRDRGKKVAIVRHPMPYGDLAAQRCQRFETVEDLDRHQCTNEEREEYETHIEEGHLVFAGVDYEEILRAAESEADVVIWDGGNNDTSFYRSDLHIVVADPHRAGHEVSYYPGETNLRMADVVVINKVDTATKEGIEEVEANARALCPEARIIRADSVVAVEDEKTIEGKRVLVVEDGPTLTHGEMSYGAGHVAARRWGAGEIVDPRPYAVGSIKKAFEDYDHLSDVLPALGYGDQQVRELEETINSVPCDLVLVGTPFNISRVLKSERPMLKVTYSMAPEVVGELEKLVDSVIGS